ncbi:MAG: hypothetical protein R3343_11730 [Nitriliruptorales bacterium]|nr:hypothetical protein [Nitriliruptorales bacterium]
MIHGNGKPRRGLEGQAKETGERLARHIALGFGVLMHLMVGAFYLGSGLLAPPWAVLVLWAVWLLLAGVMWKERRRVVVVLAMPFVAAAVWGIVMWLGDTFLGWTA